MKYLYLAGILLMPIAAQAQEAKLLNPELDCTTGLTTKDYGSLIECTLKGYVQLEADKNKTYSVACTVKVSAHYEDRHIPGQRPTSLEMEQTITTLNHFTVTDVTELSTFHVQKVEVIDTAKKRGDGSMIWGGAGLKAVGCEIDLAL